MEQKILAFNKWDCSAIKIQDPGLVRYINIKPVFVPKTGGIHAGNKFHKSRQFIVERLINRIMNPGHKGKKHFKTSYHMTGKASTAYRIVEDAFKIIEQKLKKNPIEVFVKAIENSAAREEIVTIEYGGARYPKPLESAPQRRVDQTLKLMTQGSFQKSFNSKKAIESCLAEEIISAYLLSPQSVAVSKKLETERQADSAR